MANLEGQILYDLTAKTNFSLSSERPVFSTEIVPQVLTSKLSYGFGRLTSFLTGKSLDAQSAESGGLVNDDIFTTSCHTIGSTHLIFIAGPSDGVLFSNSNGFSAPLFRVFYPFEPKSLVVWPSLSKFLVVVSRSGQSVVFINYDGELSKFDINASHAGPAILACYLPQEVFRQTEPAIFIVYAYSGWALFGLRTKEVLFSGSIGLADPLTSAAVLSKHWVLIVGHHSSSGSVSKSNPGAKGRSLCFSSFRLVPESPFLLNDSDISAISGARSYLKSIMSWVLFWRRGVRASDDSPISMSMSTSQNKMCVLHADGMLSIWSTPALRLLQVFLHPSNASTLSNAALWQEDFLSLCFRDGSFVVCNASTLESVIGVQAERFEPGTVMIPTTTDIIYLVTKQVPPNQSNQLADQSDQAIAETSGFGSWLMSYNPFRAASQAMTESSTSLTLELWGFQQVTPEQLFEIKLETEEYGDAMTLARMYGFDVDAIYARQWRKAVVNRASIEDFLAKISNREVAISECLQRVADSFDGQRELLEFGVRLTDPRGSKRPAFEPNFNALVLFLRTTYLMASSKPVTKEQSANLAWHFRILDQLKRLIAYEELAASAPEKFSSFEANFWTRIRSSDILKLAIEEARRGSVEVVECMYAFYPNLLERCRLIVLSNFPEVLQPTTYQRLLPTRQIQRKPTEFDEVLDSTFVTELLFGRCTTPVVASMLLMVPSLAPFADLDQADVAQWFIYRAEEIEELSSNVENAIKLLDLGIETGVEGLKEAFVDLKILKLLLHNCGLTSFSLKSLRSTRPADILKFMFANTRKAGPVTPQQLEKYLKSWFQAYAELLESKLASRSAVDEICSKFLSETARQDLEFVEITLRLCFKRELRSFIVGEASLLSTVLDSSFGANEEPNNIAVIAKIISYVTSRKESDSVDVLRLRNEIERLRIFVDALQTFAKYGYTATKLSELRDLCLSSPGDHLGIVKSRELLDKLLVHVARCNRSSTTSLLLKGQSPNFFWNGVLVDCLKLVESGCLAPGVNNEDVYTLYAKHLLIHAESSGTISIAKAVLTLTPPAPGRGNQPSTLASVSSQRCLNFAMSVSLLIDVASNIIDSAGDLEDPSLERARNFLKLIPEAGTVVSPEISEIDNDRLRSVHRILNCCDLMRHLKAPIVPSQLKLMSDRLGLLANIIASESRTICLEQPGVFVRLAELLQVGEDPPQSKLYALKLLASCAINAGDLEATLNYCEQLVEGNFVLAWQECAKLCEAFALKSSNDDTLFDRYLKLASFAIAHCDSPEALRSIMETRQRIIIEHCQLALRQRQESETESSGKVGKVKSAVKRGASILQVDLVRRHLSALVVGPETVGGSKPAKSAKIDDELTPLFDEALHVFRLLCCTLHCQNAMEDPSEVETVLTQLVDTERIIFASSAGRDPAFSALLACIAPSPDALRGMLEALLTGKSSWPPTDVSLAAFCAYIFALWLKSTQSTRSNDQFWLKRSHELVGEAYAAIKDHADGHASMIEAKLIEVVKTLFQVDEAQATTDELPGSIDTNKFFADVAYRNGAIVEMARDRELFDPALKLAKKYNVDESAVRLRRAKAMLLDQAVDLEEIIAIVKAPEFVGISDSLLKDFLEQVLSQIDGSDHERLLRVFNFANRVGFDNLGNKSVTASLSILQLLSNNSAMLRQSTNFLELLSASQDKLLTTFEPILDDATLPKVAELLEILPHGGVQGVSKLHRRWAVKRMMTLSVEDSSSVVGAMASFDPIFTKLLPSDFADFLFDIYGNDTFQKSVGQSTRQALLKRLIQSFKTLRQSQKHKYPAAECTSIQDAFRILARHLDRLNANCWLELELVIGAELSAQLRTDFSRTLSRSEQLVDLLVVWLPRMTNIEMMELLLTCVELETAKTVPEAFRASFSRALNSSKSAEAIALVQTVSKWNRPGAREKDSSTSATILNSLREVVRSFITSESTSNGPTLKQRLEVVRVLQTSAVASSLGLNQLASDPAFLFLDVMSKLEGSGIELLPRDLDDEESRAEVLTKIYLSSSGAVVSWQVVLDLLKAMPPFRQKFSKVVEKICDRVATAIRQDDAVDFSCHIRELYTDGRIGDEILASAAKRLALPPISNPAMAVVVLLVSPLFKSNPDRLVMEFLQQVDPATMSTRYPTLCSELIEAHLLNRLSMTHLFPALVSFIVTNQSSLPVEQLIEELVEGGADEQADYLRSQLGHNDDADASSGLLGTIKRWTFFN